MKDKIDLTEIDKKYKDKCSLIKAGKCKNVNIFLEQSKHLNQLQKELKSTNTQYNQVVTQNKNLQSDLRRHQDAINKIEEFTESIYEHIPEDRVLRQILNIVSEVKYAKKS